MKGTITIPDTIDTITPSKHVKGRLAYSKNPFMAASRGYEVSYRNRNQVAAHNVRILTEDGDNITIGFEKKVDNDLFSKIFTHAFCEKLYKLQIKGIKALTAVLCALQDRHNSTLINLPYSKACVYYKELNVEIPSRTTFSYGISNLIENEIITVCSIGTSNYWINPGVMFNGDRVKYTKMYANGETI